QRFLALGEVLVPQFLDQIEKAALVYLLGRLEALVEEHEGRGRILHQGTDSRKCLDGIIAGKRVPPGLALFVAPLFDGWLLIQVLAVDVPDGEWRIGAGGDEQRAIGME